MPMMKNDLLTRGVINALGLCVCILPPSLAVLSYFPLWISRDEKSAVSGIVLVLLAIAAIPLFKYIREWLRSPSAPTVWLILFLIFFVLSSIADEMVVICFIGFVSNIIGGLIIGLARRTGGGKDEGRT